MTEYKGELFASERQLRDYLKMCEEYDALKNVLSSKWNWVKKPAEKNFFTNYQDGSRIDIYITAGGGYQIHAVVDGRTVPVHTDDGLNFTRSAYDALTRSGGAVLKRQANRKKNKRRRERRYEKRLLEILNRKAAEHE